MTNGKNVVSDVQVDGEQGLPINIQTSPVQASTVLSLEKVCRNGGKKVTI